MAIAFDAASESALAANPQIHTHTPAGTPARAVVLISHGTTSADIVTGVTYGGVALVRWRTGFDSGGEVGRVYAYTTDDPSSAADIPTGPQAVSVARTESTTVIHVVAVTLTADTGQTEVIDYDKLDGDAGNQADPSIPLQYGGRTCMALMIHYNANNQPANLVELAGQTTVADHDFDLFVSKASRQTTPGSSDFTIGHTCASNPFAMVAMAISEVVSAFVTAGTAVNTWTVPTATIATAVSVTPSPATSAWVANNPTVVGGSDPQSVEAATAITTWVANDPAVTVGGISVTPEPASSTWTVNGPTLDSGDEDAEDVYAWFPGDGFRLRGERFEDHGRDQKRRRRHPAKRQERTPIPVAAPLPPFVVEIPPLESPERLVPFHEIPRLGPLPATQSQAQTSPWMVRPRISEAARLAGLRVGYERMMQTRRQREARIERHRQTIDGEIEARAIEEEQDKLARQKAQVAARLAERYSVNPVAWLKARRRDGGHGARGARRMRTGSVADRRPRSGTRI